MAITTAQMCYDAYSSGTNLNQWITAFVNAMVSVTGWVQTGDTGQTSLGNFSTQNVADTPYGYQIYTFTDSLSATYPIYVKFEFGAGQNAGGSCAGIWVTVGTGTNGAGTLTGQVSQRIETSDINGNTGATQFTSYFSGASNRFVCALYDSLNVNWIISIERSKDSSGNDNSDGIIFHAASRRSGTYQQFIPFTGTVVAAMPTWLGAFQLNQSMAANNLVGITFPTPFNAAPYNSGYNLAVSNGTDIPMYNQITGTIYGNSHTYLQLQYNNGINIFPDINWAYQAGGTGTVAPFGNSQSYAVLLRPMIRYD